VQARDKKRYYFQIPNVIERCFVDTDDTPAFGIAQNSMRISGAANARTFVPL